MWIEVYRVAGGVFLAAMVASAVAAGSEVVRKHGDMRVSPHCEVDVDDGTCECLVVLDGDSRDPPGHPGGKHDDFRLEPDGGRRYLRSRHGASFAKATKSAIGFSGCMGASYGKARTRVDGLESGTHICIRTDEGRFAEIRLEKFVRAEDDEVVLTYTTWER